MIVEVEFELLYKEHLIEQAGVPRLLSQEVIYDRLLVRTCNYSTIINSNLYKAMYMYVFI